MGAATHPPLDSLAQVRLASEAPLRVGQLTIDPPTRQVQNCERSETLEPRVMQVLVVLARACGRVVSRDELIDCCWEGRAVGEDAIHRVLGKLRHLASGLGQDSFAIETIRGVGYRLREGLSSDDRQQRLAVAARSLSRRSLVIGAASLTAVGAAGAGAWLFARQRHRPLPLAVQYCQRGIETRGQASLEQADRGTAFFREATRIDPQYADAWGALAWNYRGLLEFGPRPDADKYVALCRAAAARALALDPDNSDAQAALLLLEPFFRNWLEIERGLRALLREHPKNSILEYNLAYTMADVGRWRESIPLLRSVARRERFWPLPVGDLVLALHASGQDAEAEDLNDDGMKRFPGRIDFWLAKVRYLMLAGRNSEALAFAADPATRPGIWFEPIVSFQVMLLKALADGSPAARDAAFAKVKALAGSEPIFMHTAAVSCAILGKIDESFSMFEGLYLGRGPWAAYQQARPMTAALFAPPTVSLRSDPRFPILTRAVGLNAYWRSSGSMPDFERYR